MSLIDKITRIEYQTAVDLDPKLCQIIANMVNVNIPFNDTEIPGETLVKTFHNLGVSANMYMRLVHASKKVISKTTFYKPQSKIAILVGNEKYTHMSKLSNRLDCGYLHTSLKYMGFIVITIENTTNSDFKNILSRVFDLMEENCYCFFFYHGYGCEQSNTKYMLGIDCPSENINLDDCITDSYIRNEMARRKIDLGIVIMDVCRVNVDRTNTTTIEEPIHKNIYVTYSTQSSQTVYEVLKVECTTDSDTREVYEVRTDNIDTRIPRAGRYADALTSRMEEDLDVAGLLDLVHEDVEDSLNIPKSSKVKCDVDKRSLYDPITGDRVLLYNKLRETTQDFMRENCYVL